MAYPHDGIAKTLPGAWLLPDSGDLNLSDNPCPTKNECFSMCVISHQRSVALEAGQNLRKTSDWLNAESPPAIGGLKAPSANP
jgi:hypothetical protein